MPGSSTPTPSASPSQAATAASAAQPSATRRPDLDIFAANRRLTRGVNLGNALEAPDEGDWGVVLQADHFETIARVGFTAVRIPIRFSAHAAGEAPFALDPEFMGRVDWAVQQAAANGLTAILDMHHYLEMYERPLKHSERLRALWGQIAGRYRDYPEDQVYFELLNEPNGKLDAATWNAVLVDTLAVVRVTNPTRPIIIGPAGWNALDQLETLQLPADPNLIITFHYYSPFEFTHQGAEWVEGSDAWLGTSWTGTPAQVSGIERDFDRAAAWAAQNGRPVFLGEFGAYERAEPAWRALWTAAVARAAEARGFTWSYWEFCAGFGVYDPEADLWRYELLQSLIPTP